MGKARFYFALWMAKLSKPALKITGHQGTNFPGEVALKICPDFLAQIAKPKMIVGITGTNGKTTCTNMIIDILEASGKRVLSNREGANINSGIATALVNGTTAFNKAMYDTAVFEIDERSSKRILPYVQPDYMLITNLFRDSIQRNAHAEYIAQFISDNMPKKTKLILNADDLISAGVAPKNNRVYFGIEEMESDVKDCINKINDIQICPVCSGELVYDYRRYHHIGRAHCKDCGFHSPNYDYAASEVDFYNMTMLVSDKGGDMEYPIINDSIFNIYNMVSVIAVMRELGMEHSQIKKHMSIMKIIESRFSEKTEGDLTVILQMAKEKNPLANSRALDYISSIKGQKEIILMPNCLTDGDNWPENPTWIYESDYEFLNKEDITCIIVTGPYASDYELRLLLAGVSPEKIICEYDEFTSANIVPLIPGEIVCIISGMDHFPVAEKARDRIFERAREMGR